MNNNDILVFSIALGGYSQIFQNCIETQRNYCSKFGFDYVLVDQAPQKLLPSEAAWLKLFLLRSALNCDYDWIAFIDADCEIRAHAPSFAQELEGIKNKTIFMAQGFSGRINSGVIFMRKSTEAIDYLEKVIENGDKEVPDKDKALYENGHMIHYGKDNPDVEIIESEKWNNNIYLSKESFIQHYSGGKLRKHYLQHQSRPKQKNFLFRQFKKVKGKFTSKKPTITMQRVNSLVSFYQKTYSAFDCNK